MRTLELRAEKVVAGGDALCREPSGRVVLVPGLLPGEAAVVELVADGRDLGRAGVARLLDPSPDRIEPACLHVARGCGGCPWAHVRPEAQPGLKQALVSEALARTGGLRGLAVGLGPRLPDTGFRTTLRLALAGGRPGFRAARSHRVVPVGDCRVAHPRLAGLLPSLRAAGASEVQLRAGAATGERSATALPGGRLSGLPADVAVGPRAVVHEVVAGRRLRVSAGSFFQTRADGAEALVAAVAEAVAGAPDGPFLDAYGGVGLFGATVAGGRPVTVVEASASSAADARRNLPDARVVAVPLERWRPEPAAVVVADPPRSGLQAAGVAALAATGAGRVALVSCDPVAHARDLRLLVEAGYTVGSTVVVDLFPHTPHVEVVSRLDR